MSPKRSTPTPIDRPLSKAYLRQFTGWSTAYPPGLSEPNSLRLMENVWVTRNGAMAVRPGLHYLSYTEAPDLDPIIPGTPGTTMAETPVSAPEVFYTNDGERALLIAVRESNDRVGFRVLRMAGTTGTVHDLTDPLIGFTIPQGVNTLRFTSDTTHVTFLQINNRILALSDAGEPARLFYVGVQKIARKLTEITVPFWSNAHKPVVVHPDAAWIDARVPTTRRNLIVNPTFESGIVGWKVAPGTGSTPLSGTGWYAELSSLPTRTNMVPAPLHDVTDTGIDGWNPGEGDPDLAASGDYLQVACTEADTYFADGPKAVENVKAGRRYRIGVDVSVAYGPSMPVVKASAYATNGALITERIVEVTSSSGRWVSPVIEAPAGSTTLRLSLGLVNTTGEPSAVRFRNVVMCEESESTTMFHGGSGTDHFWVGQPNQSASVYHPARQVRITSPQAGASTGVQAAGSIEVDCDDPVDWWVGIERVTRTTTAVSIDGSGTTVAAGWETVSGSTTVADADAIGMALMVAFEDVARGTTIRVRRALLERGTLTAGEYFDGDTPGSPTVMHEWVGQPHLSESVQDTYAASQYPIPAEDATADTLIATGGATANEYKMGLFYTFENEVGESAPSKITEVRMQRPWSNWVWETPNVSGEPSGSSTNNADLCADQLAVWVPEEVYEQARTEGALRWNLYAFTWSDQDPVPATAALVETRDIAPEQSAPSVTGLDHSVGGWVTLTPSRVVGVNDMLLPTKESRVNYSTPPTDRNGFVAGDRIVLVGSPDTPATIRWSSNRIGSYLNFSAAAGGGQKTLSSGNLNLPHSVVLWQNPQSVDTLTVLCSDDNGMSNSYYMQPAQVQGSAGVVAVMGFEETTSTPGTISPHGAQVLNNALYRPLDEGLLKSTANNYNINHQKQTDQIVNMWELLQSKSRMKSARLDNRLYYLVHNPTGEVLQPNCSGNEIWVYDINAKTGVWARLLIQGSALKPVTVGSRNYLCVTTPQGLFYLDPDRKDDDFVTGDLQVERRPIPWMFETNTQGANRAHDAWAHVQQVGISLGNFRGKMRYGIRGWSQNGRRVDVSKEVSDNGRVPPVGETWDLEDYLLIRRDMKEWFFRAESLPGEHSEGEVCYVQYRYTPISVNIGYEFGSVETFEYGSRAQDAYVENGIPLPYMDRDRP